jgi:phenylacetic acid degradation operon negative regulatory protein
MTVQRIGEAKIEVGVTDPRPIRTQFLIFTLFGEYVVQRGGNIWTSSLLNLMSLLGLNERAVRSTLSRMSQKGWIKATKYGRKSRYSITSRGHALLEEGHQRIFEDAYTDWDGQWYMAFYSLPEDKRRLRHFLRTKFSWLGFGQLAPGTWISPHDRQVELMSLIEELDVQPHVDVFSGAYLGPSSIEELVHRCWDLAALEKQYLNFISKHQKQYEHYLNQDSRECQSKREELFVRRFWLTHDFQSFPLKDPNLPTDLLPDDWIGFAARDLFDRYREFLSAYVDEFVDNVILGSGLPSG